MSDLYCALDGFYIQTPDDPAKWDLELACEKCESVLCDVEHGDGLDTLARMAEAHACTGRPFPATCSHEPVCDDEQECERASCDLCLDEQPCIEHRAQARAAAAADRADRNRG